MRLRSDLPEVPCPRCRRQRLGARAGTFSTRVNWLCQQVPHRLVRRLLTLRFWCGTCRGYVSVPQELPRVVIGYHGCRRDFARALA